jgi:hypothetical protein
MPREARPAVARGAACVSNLVVPAIPAIPALRIIM